MSSKRVAKRTSSVGPNCAMVSETLIGTPFFIASTASPKRLMLWMMGRLVKIPEMKDAKIAKRMRKPELSSESCIAMLRAVSENSVAAMRFVPAMGAAA